MFPIALLLALGQLLDSNGKSHGFLVQAQGPPFGRSVWEAMGDSYSAGPGAGDSYDNFQYGDNNCFRGTGAYAPKMDAIGKERLGNFQFLSCTGHKTGDMARWQFPDIQWDDITTRHRFTLSIGGNDLKFSKYIKACLFGLRGTDCEAVVREIDNLLDNKDGQDTLRKSLENNVLTQYRHQGSLPHLSQPVLIYQTGYPEFFQVETDRCNDVKIGPGRIPIIVNGPTMTRELRDNTNKLVRRANDRIKSLAEAFANTQSWLKGRYQFVDYGDTFDGHRLCEDFVTDGVGFSNKDVWFLGIGQNDADDDDENPNVHANAIQGNVQLDQIDPNSCDPDTGNLAFSMACTLVQYKAQNPDFDLDSVVLPLWLTKAFHPKSSGFNRVRDRLLDVMFPPRPALRVLALGDSITNGFKSTDGNGYRKVFFDSAEEDRSVDMIGSVRAGTMSDNDNEGHNGAKISEISNYADDSLRARPNVVLLHAGTNDMDSDADANGAIDRLTALIDKITTQCPDAAVLVSRLIPSTDGRQSRIDSYNAALTSLVNSMEASGRQVTLMFMDQAAAGELADGLHPNDAGYAQMGQDWYGGVLYADQKGWIKEPVAASPAPHHDVCTSVPNWIPQGEIANGGGNGQALRGTYACYSDYCIDGGTNINFVGCEEACRGGRCTQAPNSSDGFVCTGCDQSSATEECTCAHPGTGGIPEPNPAGVPCIDLAYKYYNTVQFADIDGDGLDDYLWVDEQGKVIMYRNAGQAPDQGPNAAKVVWYPMGTIATGVGALGRQVRLADLDGDGRADYILVKDDGSATVWWNLGFDANRDPKVIWHSATGEEIATGIGDGDGVRFADMNGDGKADFIHLDENAAATLYINEGRNADGTWGWWNWGVVAGGVGGNRRKIRFADMNGDGQADYCVVAFDTGRTDVWYNQGPTSKSWSIPSDLQWWNSTTQKNAPVASGVTYLDKWTDGSMVTFGDLNGDGRDEYLYVGLRDSSVYAFLNGC